MPNTVYKTGAVREQSLLLPPCIDEYVGPESSVRAIDAYVHSLNLAKMKFRHTSRPPGAGQPPYNPADLLKLYIYGYLNQIRSSRRLEREAARNIELMWLLGSLVPGYRTIAKFRSENAAALKQANRDFLMLLRGLDLVGGERIAIDGAFFDGNASKASIVTRKRLEEQVATLDREIEAYTAALDANDVAEARQATLPLQPTAASTRTLAELLAKRAAAAADVAGLEASGQTQLSRTDPDARQLSKNGQSMAGYNVQIAVDAKHKLIVTAEAVNDGNDTGQLHAVARAACEAMGVDTVQAVADAGYYNGDTLKACEDSGIEAFVPEPRRGQHLAKTGRFGAEAFSFDAEAGVYRCPAGQTLKPMQGHRQDSTGKTRIRYASLRAACAACPLRPNCLSDKADRRVIERWEHEDVIERHRARMAADTDMMRTRKTMVEHPFGTLKCRAGYRHFLMRGFAKVRAELSLMVLCYNFTRVLTLIGLENLLTHLAARRKLSAFLLLDALRTALGRLRMAARSLKTKTRQQCRRTLRRRWASKEHAAFAI